MTQLGESNFYVGGGDGAVLKNPAAYFTKFCLQVGVTAAAFGDPKKRRNGMSIESKAGPRGIRPGAPVSMLFAERYVRSGSAIQWIPERIQSILSRSEWKFEFSTEEHGTVTYVGEKVDEARELKESRKGGNTQKRKREEDECLLPEKLVRSLVWALQGESLELAFPYLLMHRWCWKMLRAVKDTCHPLLREKYTGAYMENETELPFVVGYILMANSGMGGEPQDDRLLRTAAEALNPFADTAGKLGMMILGKMGFNIDIEDGET